MSTLVRVLMALLLALLAWSAGASWIVQDDVVTGDALHPPAASGGARDPRRKGGAVAAPEHARDEDDHARPQLADDVATSAPPEARGPGDHTGAESSDVLRGLTGVIRDAVSLAPVQDAEIDVHLRERRRWVRRTQACPNGRIALTWDPAHEVEDVGNITVRARGYRVQTVSATQRGASGLFELEVLLEPLVGRALELLCSRHDGTPFLGPLVVSWSSERETGILVSPATDRALRSLPLPADARIPFVHPDHFTGWLAKTRFADHVVTHGLVTCMLPETSDLEIVDASEQGGCVLEARRGDSVWSVELGTARRTFPGFPTGTWTFDLVHEGRRLASRSVDVPAGGRVTLTLP